jgi:hypothetical protein
MGLRDCWEFRPKLGYEKWFEEAYGASGIWLNCSDRSGFVATELSRDSKDPRRHLTLDFWESKLAYERFRAERAKEYAALDDQCETFTEFERELAQFERVPP